MRIAAGILLLGVVLSGCGGSVTLPRESAAKPTATPVRAATPGLMYVGASASAIAAYSTAASGNVSPSHLFAGTTPFGANATGLWALNDVFAPLYQSVLPVAYATATHFSPDGHVLAAIPIVQQAFPIGTTAGATDEAGNIYLGTGSLVRIPDNIGDPLCQFERDGAVLEYSAGSTQSSKPIRSIAVIETCSIFSMAVDRAGHLWVAGTSVLDQGVNGETEIPSISEYAVAASTSAKPLRTLALNSGYVVNLATDSTDRVYVIAGDKLIRYGAQLQDPQVLLASENGPDAVYGIQSADRLAIDAHDIVYVQTKASQSQPLAVRVFDFPNTKPIRVLSGVDASIGGTGIAVTR